MRSLYRFSVARPWVTLFLAACACVAAAPGLQYLKLRSDGHALVPRDAPEVVFDRSIRSSFGIEDLIVLVIRSNDPTGIFNVRTLGLVVELTREIARLDGMRLASISSLATEPSEHFRPGTLDFRRFLEPPPATQAECDRIREELEALRVFTGTLVSSDGRATTILVGIPEGRDRTELCEAVQDLVLARRGSPETIQMIGAPVAEALLGAHILDDLGIPRGLLGSRLGRQPSAAWGLPSSFDELAQLARQHVGLLPAAILVMSGVFLASFRRLAAVLLPLGEVGACLLFIFGLMGWLGVPVYLTITVMPVILTITGVTDEIHVFSAYRRRILLEGYESHAKKVLATMEELHAPVLKASVTTAIGFLSFVTSPLEPVRAFGIFTGVGMIFCLLWSLTVIPALLVLGKARWFVAGRAAAGSSLDPRPVREPGFARLGKATVRRRRWVLGAALVLVLAAPLGLLRLRVQDSWVDGFDRHSDFYRATQAFNDDFFGMHLLAVCVDASCEAYQGEIAAELVGDHQVSLPAGIVKDPRLLVGRSIEFSRADRSEAAKGPAMASGPWSSWIDAAVLEGDHIALSMPRQTGSPKFFLQLRPGEKGTYRITARRFLVPSVLRLTRKLGVFLKAQRDKAVGGVLEPADFLGATNFILRKRDPAAREIPDDPWRIDTIWRAYASARGERRLREVVDAGFDRALVSVYLKNANFEDTARLMEEVRAYERAHLAPWGIRLEFAGDVAVSQAMIQGIVTTQVSSVTLSLVGTLAVVVLLGRSLRWGIYCILPCSLAVLFNFAMMGFLDVTLGVATSMFAAITLGIGVDFAIHLLDRYKLSRASGHDENAALIDAITATGPAIVIDGLAVALGFGVLAFSRVPANVRLGEIAMFSIVGCLLATIILLPALVVVAPLSRDRAPRQPSV